MSNPHTDTGHHDGPDTAHATFKGYMTGFILSVILTVIPFSVVMGEVFESAALTIGIIIALGAVQIMVHMIYFLHMDAKAEDGWNLLSLLFSGMLIVIMLVGSMWIMFHLHDNTMPPAPAEMRVMP